MSDTTPKPWFALVTWWANTPTDDEAADELAATYTDELPRVVYDMPGIVFDSISVVECNSPMRGMWPVDFVTLVSEGASAGWPAEDEPREGAS